VLPVFLLPLDLVEFLLLDLPEFLLLVDLFEFWFCRLVGEDIADAPMSENARMAAIANLRMLNSELLDFRGPQGRSVHKVGSCRIHERHMPRAPQVLVYMIRPISAGVKNDGYSEPWRTNRRVEFSTMKWRHRFSNTRGDSASLARRAAGAGKGVRLAPR
jgi:hypothetical protein